jgi:hypothetical protein
MNQFISNNHKTASYILYGVAIVLFALFVLPPITMALENTLRFLLYCIPLILLVMFRVPLLNFIASNVSKFDKQVINGNKPYFLRQQYEAMIKNVDSIQETITVVKSQYNTLKERLHLKTNSLKSNMAKSQSNSITEIERDTFKTKVAIDNQAIKEITPEMDFLKTQYEKLIELHQMKVAEAEKFSYRIENLIEKYELAKQINKTQKKISILSSDQSQTYKNYVESLRQTEKAIAQYSAYSEEFTRRLQPTLTNLRLENEASLAEADSLIEEYRKNTSLLIEGS